MWSIHYAKTYPTPLHPLDRGRAAGPGLAGRGSKRCSQAVTTRSLGPGRCDRRAASPCRDFPRVTSTSRSSAPSGDGQAPAPRRSRKAIAACRAAGGGRVVVPAGRFLTGADPPREQRQSAPGRRGDARASAATRATTCRSSSRAGKASS